MTVRFWAGARRAAGHAEEQLTAASLGDVREQLAARAELAGVVAASAFLVDGEQAADDAPLPSGAVVDVLPPFAGGAAQTRLEALVSGFVQGVGFRAWADDRMAALGLSGSARNLPDGRVQVIAEGDRDACDRLVGALRGAAPPGRIDEVVVSWS